MTAPAHCRGSASIEDFGDEALITEAIRRGLIARDPEDWSSTALRILADLEWAAMPLALGRPAPAECGRLPC